MPVRQLKPKLGWGHAYDKSVFIHVAGSNCQKSESMACSICRSHLRRVSRLVVPTQRTAPQTRLPTFKNAILRTVSTSQVRLEEEKMDDLQKNPYYSKYASKIAQLQK